MQLNITDCILMAEYEATVCYIESSKNRLQIGKIAII